MAMYFTTDTHFGHPLVSALRGFITVPEIKEEYDRIVAERGRAEATLYVKRAVAADPSLSMRAIADTDAHDRAVIASINATIEAGVDEGVDLWILGDIGYRTTMEHIRHCLRALHADRLHLVIGNHDINFHHRELDGEWRHVFATIQDSAQVEIDGVTYNLSHFPYRDDLGPARSGADGDRASGTDTSTGSASAGTSARDGSDNAYDTGFAADALPRDGHRLLFGHTHQHTKPGRNHDSLHVGLDSWDLKPVSEAEVTAWFASL